mgnify:CR=1 FL=1
MMHDAFESSQKADGRAYGDKDWIQAKSKPIHNWLSISSVNAYLGAPSTSHDFLSGITFEKQPGEYRA